jgi:hypothetical protein
MTNSKLGVMPTIKMSNDYSSFVRIKGNRNLNKAHIRRFKEALSEDATSIKYNPILVNEKNEVIDGQHRFEALKALSLPVYYIQVDELELKNAQVLNKLSKPWNPMDYARSYAELGNKNYITYIEFKEKYRFNHDILMKYLSLDNPITGDMFRSGKLMIKDRNKSSDLCDKLLDISEFYRRFDTRAFALAFKNMWSNPRYSHDRLVYKLRNRPNAIQDRGIPEEYMRDLEKIYNHSLPEGERIRVF